MLSPPIGSTCKAIRRSAIKVIVKLQRGTQVVYRHRHYEGTEFSNLHGLQAGFVTSGLAGTHGDSYFVRYWLIQGGKVINELRTKANSELTKLEDLEVVDSVPQEWVEAALERYC